MMEGLEVHGTRTTQTLKTVASLTAVRETLSSSAVGLTMLVEASGPSWRHTAKLQNVDRNEPIPPFSLFRPTTRP